ncbi:MAG: DUF6062 family protein [Defluviitaleaceae bacterium]|nr:DUF6062 family protein [Defluviitaleaceae bacterium]MCL2275558.1 DUF6062 family protein [Defluviitaleaceae bacterium]
MADHIHTIPVLDALREPKNCAFCVMHENLEKAAVNFIMSPAYMEDDVRRATNEIGFCRHHLAQMYEEQNRLGLALMLHTHLLKLNADIEKLAKRSAPAPFFGKDTSGPIAKLMNHLQGVDVGCYVCNRVNTTFDRYIDTYFHLLNKGGEEARLIKNQNGYCLNHFIALLEHAVNMGRGKREAFIEEILPTQQKMMQNLAEDLEHFTIKFDHRNAELPWNNAKDALLRAVAALGGEK